MNPIQNIRKYYNNFSSKEKLIADYILWHTDKVVTTKIVDLAEELDVSAPLISKFAKKYCQMSFQDLKVYLAMNGDQSARDYSNDLMDWGSDLGKLPSNILEEINTTCKGIMEINDAKSFEEVVKAVYKAENIYFFAVGSSALAANDFIQKLLRLGKRCTYFFDPHSNLLNSYLVTEKDLAFFVSFDGRTKEVNIALNEIKKRNVKTVAITRYGDTKLSSNADIVLSIPSFELEKTRVAPIFSRYGQMFIVDILFLSLTQKLDNSLEYYMEQNNTLFENLKEQD